jgi:hypothetical protein
MIMLLNRLLDIPHLSGGWIILAKEKCSLICAQNVSNKLLKNVILILYMLRVYFLFSIDIQIITSEDRFPCFFKLSYLSGNQLFFTILSPPFFAADDPTFLGSVFF